MKMSKTGDKIDYSLRLQKSIERKIFCDVVRTLNYFGTVEDYRYIGFGSFYYQDFLMFYEDFNICKGISIEIDSEAYVNKTDMISCIQQFFLFLLEKDKAVLINDLFAFLRDISHKYNTNEINNISDYIAKKVVELYLKRINTYSRDFFSDMKLKGANNYKSFDEISKQLYLVLQSTLSCIIKDEIVKMVEIEESNDHILLETILTFDSEKYLRFDLKDISSIVQKALNNRYIYNKPYGFIKLLFGELNKAFDSVVWNENQKNIIWLDYDAFIDETQLLGLEKSILNSSRGDLIIFSTSMGTDAKCRYDSLKEIKETTHRIVGKISKGDCDDKFIYKPIRTMVSNAVKAAISKKNAGRPKGTPVYKATAVLECTYSDRMPMYTYGIIIHYSEDNEVDERFPANCLRDKKWFPKEDECYRIYVPALTHKEVNAINQMLPGKNAEEICDVLPFIPRSTIKKYVDIWNYYPHFFEVGNYV